MKFYTHYFSFNIIQQLQIGFNIKQKCKKTPKYDTIDGFLAKMAAILDWCQLWKMFEHANLAYDGNNICGC